MRFALPQACLLGHRQEVVPSPRYRCPTWDDGDLCPDDVYDPGGSSELDPVRHKAWLLWSLKLPGQKHIQTRPPRRKREAEVRVSPSSSDALVPNLSILGSEVHTVLFQPILSQTKRNKETKGVPETPFAAFPYKAILKTPRGDPWSSVWEQHF